MSHVNAGHKSQLAATGKDVILVFFENVFLDVWFAKKNYKKIKQKEFSPKNLQVSAQYGQMGTGHAYET